MQRGGTAASWALEGETGRVLQSLYKILAEQAVQKTGRPSANLPQPNPGKPNSIQPAALPSTSGRNGCVQHGVPAAHADAQPMRETRKPDTAQETTQK